VTQSPDTRLGQPVSETGRRLALELLWRWDDTRTRLAEAADPEALHDFRVAQRRLRSVLRAFRADGDALVPGRLRRRLGRLALITGASRDFEVQRIWLQGRIPLLTPRQQGEARWMLARLEHRESRATRQLLRRVARRYGPLYKRLEAALEQSESPEGGTYPDSGPIAPVVSQCLAEWAERLETRLASITSIRDQTAAHQSRILVKRIRYLLEPFEAELAGAPEVLGRLEKLQDVLGNLHDQFRLAAELRRAFREAAVSHADQRYHEMFPWEEPAGEPDRRIPAVPTGGLAALARILAAEAESQFAQLKDEWLVGGGGTKLCASVRALAEACAD
jgi:CHAD domain-containing protein